MRALYLASVFLHLVSAAVWIGGMLFIALMLVPLVRQPQYRQSAGELLHLLGVRFRWWGWVSLGIFFVTGVFNMTYRFGGALLAAEFWRNPAAHPLATKIVLFGLIVALSAIHDFYIGPKAVAAMERDLQSAEAQRLRKQASWMGRINLLLGLIMMLLGILIVRGLP